MRRQGEKEKRKKRTEPGRFREFSTFRAAGFGPEFTVEAPIILNDVVPFASL